MIGMYSSLRLFAGIEFFPTSDSTVVIEEEPQPGVTQQDSRLSIPAALKREGTRDGEIDLASVTCLVQFNRIEIMECKFCVRILQFVSANEVR
jgi:hypothetical protein